MGPPLNKTTAPLLAGALLLSACGDDGAGQDGEETGTSETTSAEAETSTATTDPSTGTGDTGFDPIDPVCGNGYVEMGEECDDGNRDDGDSCSSACLVPCGLEWSTTRLGPSLESEIWGVQVARDDDDNVLVIGHVQLITTDQEGVPQYSDDEILVLKYDSMGELLWEVSRVNPDGDANAADIAVDSSGAVVIAATYDGAVEGNDIVVSKLDGADGSELWSVVHDEGVDDSEDLAAGVAVGPDGDVVVSGHVTVSPSDDDIWIRKMAGADGTEVWTTTHSGDKGGMFSGDRGGPVIVGDAGEVYALGRIYVDFETHPTELLAFAADGGPPLWTHRPVLEGANQEFFPVDLAIDQAGDVYFAVERPLPSQVEFWIHRIDDMQQIVWTRDRSEYERGGDDWRLLGLALTPAGELVLGGHYENDERLAGTSWFELWFARLDLDGNTLCQVAQKGPIDGLIPPDLFARGGIASGIGGEGLITGEQDADGESSIWLGSFRPL